MPQAPLKWRSQQIARAHRLAAGLVGVLDYQVKLHTFIFDSGFYRQTQQNRLSLMAAQYLLHNIWAVKFYRLFFKKHQSSRILGAFDGLSALALYEG